MDAKKVSPPPLHEAFQTPDCHVSVTTLFIDVANSTAMQQNEPEGSWVPQMGWFYQKVNDLLIELRATVPEDVDTKYLGDGIMVTTSSRFAAELVNFGIRVQEEVNKASRRAADGGKNKIFFNVAIGVATGKVYRFTAPDGLVDYVSKVVSTARRLCDAATPRAVFIDEATSFTNMSFVTSQYGEAEGRETPEYLGDRSFAPLKGLREPIAYYEILWEVNRFGVKGETATTAVEQARDAGKATKTASLSIDKPQRFSGVVKAWNGERGYGFITNDAGQDFYFNPQLLAYAEDAADVRIGDRVAFMGLPPAKNGAAPQAAVILFDDEDAEGTVQSLPTHDRKYGWIVIEDGRGTRHFVYLGIEAAPKVIQRGDKVEFTVRVGHQGASATKVRRPGEPDEPTELAPVA